MSFKLVGRNTEILVLYKLCVRGFPYKPYLNI